MNSAHTVSTASGPTWSSPKASRPLPAWSAPAALAAVLVLAAVLYTWALGSLGWGNAYYSAAVKSMGRNWTNFLFGAYDPAGVLTVDKPPASLWPQVVSSKVFGLHGWSLILPQAVEGVAAVLVLHRTVRRWAGEGAGLLAALVLTLTPITVAINRDNNPDTLLVLLLVSAAYALTRALQASGRAATWWLCASAFLIGCGFLTKMLAAWMVVPAFAAAWLVGGSGAWTSRVGRLLGAGAVLAASSLWWVAMVALWPGDHPYIGGSKDGSAWNLVVGYNGLGRVFGQDIGPGGAGSGGGMTGGGATFGGASGVGRLFNDQVAGQIAWLLPACGVALALAVGCVLLRRRGQLAGQTLLPSTGWVLWGTWLLVCAAVFSKQEGIFHPYYTTQLAPAIAALCGGLMAALVRLHRAGRPWAVHVAVATVAVTAAWAVVIIRRTSDWHGWLMWPVLLAGAAAVTLLLLARRRIRLLAASLAATVIALLAAPGAWAATVPATSMTGSNPTAGPTVTPFGKGGMPTGGMTGGMAGGGQPQQGGGRQSGMPSGMPSFPSGGFGGQQSGGLPSGMPTGMEGFPGGGSGGQPGGMPSGMPEASGGSGSTGNGQSPSLPGGDAGFGGGGSMGGRMTGAAHLTANQRKMLDYAVKQAPRARIKLAVEGGAMSSAAFILDSDETVIGMGGFTNTDNAPSVAQLTKWTRNGELRYILGSDNSDNFGSFGSGLQQAMGMSKDSPVSQRTEWIKKHCAKVPASAYGGSSSTSSKQGSGGGTGFGGGGTVLYDCAAK